MQNRITHLREARGWSMRDLAERCATTPSTINKLEKGQMALTLDWMVQIGAALGVSAADLIINAEVSSGGFSDNAEPYVPPPGHYLASGSDHFSYFRMTTDDLDQHPAGLGKGKLLVFNLNRTAREDIKAGEVVFASLLDKADFLRVRGGRLIAQFLPPNKLCSNSRTTNWILPMEDERKPDVGYVIRGVFDSVISDRN